MNKYRKKPVVIEAAENTGGSKCHVHIAQWASPWTLDFGPEGEIYIETLEGTMRADLGDWIIRGVEGELYPCKPNIFEATYEAVEA